MTLAPEHSLVDMSLSDEATVVKRWVDDRHRLHEQVEWTDGADGYHRAEKQSLPYEFDDAFMEKLVKDALAGAAKVSRPGSSRY